MELSGHEWQRAEGVRGWGCQRGTEGGAEKGGGGQDPVVLTHSSDRQPYLGDLVWGAVLSDLGGGGAALKVHGGGRGGSSPLASFS